MALKPVHPDEFEALMREAHEAERAGVFGQTRLDIEGLMARPVHRPAPRLYRFALAGLPMAACLALFLGLAAYWPGGSNSSHVPDGRASGSHSSSSAAERCETLENFRACFSGPGAGLGTNCQCADKDADGDVDLRDLGLFQLAEAGH